MVLQITQGVYTDAFIMQQKISDAKNKNISIFHFHAAWCKQFYPCSSKATSFPKSLFKNQGGDAKSHENEEQFS